MEVFVLIECKSNYTCDVDIVGVFTTLNAAAAAAEIKPDQLTDTDGDWLSLGEALAYGTYVIVKRTLT